MQTFIKNEDYEKAARHRDRHKQLLVNAAKVEEELPQTNHISDIQFVVPLFYQIDFTVKDNTITIDRDAGEYYAIASLLKVLYELGGKNKDSGSSAYPKKWNKLKPWDQYSWYNRPKKIDYP